LKIKNIFTKYINIYRIIVAIGFITAMVLILVFPVRMIGASPWAYYYGVKNFADGKFVIDDQLHTSQVNDARQQGGNLMQYVEIGDNQWALEKAPGYVLYLVPFEWMGIPRWGDVVLALGMIIVTYILLKRIRDEKTACIGSLLTLFTPVTLIMLNLTYFDTLASLAFMVMGGGLYIYYRLERNSLQTFKGAGILFLAFLLISWSVVTRYTNFPIAAIFAIHYAATLLISLRKNKKTKLLWEILSVALGIGLPLTVLLIYNNAVFSSPFDYGYNYTRFPTKFAFQYIGQVDKNGQSVALQIIIDNLRAAPKPLLLGFPLLVIGIPGIIYVLYRKFAAIKKQSNTRSSLNNELPWDILLILIGWFISVFGLYLTYEFTAEYLGDGSSFIRFARFYLPGLFPIVVVSSLIITRFPYKLYIPVLLAVIIAGSIIYNQYITDKSSGMGSSSPGNIPRTQQTTRVIPGTTSTVNRSSLPQSYLMGY
jgi:hypothetical protein